jgi:hypothetical protein
LVHAYNDVPSSERTSWKTISTSVVVRALEAGMPRFCPSTHAGRGR